MFAAWVVMGDPVGEGWDGMGRDGTGWDGTGRLERKEGAAGARIKKALGGAARRGAGLDEALG